MDFLMGKPTQFDYKFISASMFEQFKIIYSYFS